MSLVDRIGYVFSTKDAKTAIDSDKKRLGSPDQNVQAQSHFFLWKVYNVEATRFFPLSLLYRSLAEHHLDEAILRATYLPGPLGVRAQMQIAKGEFREGIDNLEVEFARLINWINVVEADCDEQRLKLAEYQKLGGIAYGMIGQFEKGRELFSLSLQGFRSFAPEVRVQRPEVEEQIVLGTAWFFQMENKYAEALSLIDEELRGFSFSLFPTSVHDRLKSVRVMLAEYIPIVAEFSGLPSVQEILAELMEKIQSCDNVESALRIRKDVIFNLKKQVFDLKINALVETSVTSIEKQVKVAEKIFEGRLPSSDDPVTTGDRDFTVIADPELRESVRQMYEFNRTTKETLARIQNMMDERKKAMFEITGYINAKTIIAIKKFEQRAYRVPWSHRIEWAFLLLARKGIQLVVVAILIEKLLEGVLKKNISQMFEHLKLHPAEYLIEGSVILAIFLIGGLVETLIDERATKRYKRSLISLVMSRSTTLWTTYNALVKVASSAQAKLRKLEAAAEEMAILSSKISAPNGG